MNQEAPSERTVKQVIEDLTDKSITQVDRFTTGKAHFVYDVKTINDELVVRLTKLGQKSSFESALYWYQILKPLGVPLPKFRSYDIEGNKFGFPVIVMDRLPGSDLLDAYKDMNNQQKEDLAREIVDIQKKVGTLKEGPGFGYATSYEDSKLHPSWQGVMDQYMQRITTRNNKTG